MCMTFGANFVYAADSNSARNAVLQIREEIDSHKSNIQSKTVNCLNLHPKKSPKRILRIMIRHQLTVGELTCMSFLPAVFQTTKGKDGTINTLAPNEYKIYTVRLNTENIRQYSIQTL